MKKAIFYYSLFIALFGALVVGGMHFSSANEIQKENPKRVYLVVGYNGDEQFSWQQRREYAILCQQYARLKGYSPYVSQMVMAQSPMLGMVPNNCDDAFKVQGSLDAVKTASAWVEVSDEIWYCNDLPSESAKKFSELLANKYKKPVIEHTLINSDVRVNEYQGKISHCVRNVKDMTGIYLSLRNI